MDRPVIHRPLDDLKIAALASQSAEAVNPQPPHNAEIDVMLMQLLPSRMLNLRFDPGNTALKETIEQIIWANIPTMPNSRSSNGSVWWLAPDEWMITDPNRAESIELADKLSKAAGENHHSIVDVSHQFEGFRVAGPLARDLLAHIITLDLHPSVLKANSVIQTVAAHCSITFLVNEDAESFDIYARRSFIQYLWKRMVDAAADMDLAIVSNIH